MTEAELADAGAAPGLVFRGRYAVIDLPDGRMSIPWTTEPCDRCQGCGCGQQQNPLELPAAIAGIVRAKLNGEELPMLNALKMMRRR